MKTKQPNSKADCCNQPAEAPPNQTPAATHNCTTGRTGPSNHPGDCPICDDRQPALSHAESAAGPCILVIFGASGDLSRRKLLPALANLRDDGLLADSFAVVGVATRPWPDEKFRSIVDAGPESVGSADSGRWLAQRMHYLSGDFEKPDTYERLAELLSDLDARLHTQGNYLFYLSTAPPSFPRFRIDFTLRDFCMPTPPEVSHGVG